jgi:hypothetical protein
MEVAMDLARSHAAVNLGFLEVIIIYLTGSECTGADDSQIVQWYM